MDNSSQSRLGSGVELTDVIDIDASNNDALLSSSSAVPPVWHETSRDNGVIQQAIESSGGFCHHHAMELLLAILFGVAFALPAAFLVDPLLSIFEEHPLVFIPTVVDISENSARFIGFFESNGFDHGLMWHFEYVAVDNASVVFSTPMRPYLPSSSTQAFVQDLFAGVCYAVALVLTFSEGVVRGNRFVFCTSVLPFEIMPRNITNCFAFTEPSLNCNHSLSLVKPPRMVRAALDHTGSVLALTAEGGYVERNQILMLEVESGFVHFVTCEYSFSDEPAFVIFLNDWVYVATKVYHVHGYKSIVQGFQFKADPFERIGDCTALSEEFDKIEGYSTKCSSLRHNSTDTVVICASDSGITGASVSIGNSSASSSYSSKSSACLEITNTCVVCKYRSIVTTSQGYIFTTWGNYGYLESTEYNDAGGAPLGFIDVHVYDGSKFSFIECLSDFPVCNCTVARGIGVLIDVVASFDGGFLYTLSRSPGGLRDRCSIAVFQIDMGNGTLRQLEGTHGCIVSSEDQLVGSCDSAFGFNDCSTLTIAQDGESLFVLSDSGSLITFARNSSTGALRVLRGQFACASRFGAFGCMEAAGTEIGLLCESTNVCVQPALVVSSNDVIVTVLGGIGVYDRVLVNKSDNSIPDSFHWGETPTPSFWSARVIACVTSMSLMIFCCCTIVIILVRRIVKSSKNRQQNPLTLLTSDRDCSYSSGSDCFASHSNVVSNEAVNQHVFAVPQVDVDVRQRASSW